MAADDFGPQLPAREDSVLRHLLEARGAAFPDRVFVRFEDGASWTYGEALAQARAAAAGLAALGVEAGDVVLAMLRNGPDYLRTWFGVNFLSAILAAPNVALRGAILQHVVELSGARVAVIEADLVERLAGLGTGQVRTIVTAAVPEALPAGIAHVPVERCLSGEGCPPAPDRVVEPWDAEFILFTSGTTGPAKGAIVTYVQMHDMVLASFDGRLDASDVYLVNMPLFHVAGTRGVQGMLMLAGAIALLPGFRTETFWDTVRHHGATATVLLGSAARFLEDRAPRPDDADNPMRLMAMVPLVADPPAFARRFGVSVATSYGMSELSLPIVSPVNPTLVESCGRLRRGYEARLVDGHDRAVAPGEVGELVLRADRPWTISPGYWGMADATAAAWRNGWFHTGDRFRRTGDGDYVFVDRKKDAIRRRGENVSSFEVESAIVGHPEVADAAAIGVPSPVGEEGIMAVVVPAPGAAHDPAALLIYLGDRMAHFMVPRYIRIVADLPRTPSMRVQKHLLRDEGITADTWDREAAGIVVRRAG